MKNLAPEEARALGMRIKAFLDTEANTLGMNQDERLELILSAAYGQAVAMGLSPKTNPRVLFDRAARCWDSQMKTQKIVLVSEIPLREIETNMRRA